MAGSLKWHSYGITHPGCSRTINEDAILDRPEQALWAVADGMGGHERGDKASRAITTALGEIGPADTLGQRIDAIEDALAGVNSELLRYSEEQLGGRTIGSTVAGLTLGVDTGIVFWMGDSRVYRFRQRQLQALTQDHSEVEELLAYGHLTPDEADLYPERNVITRAIGVEQQLFLDLDSFRPDPGDLYLLCSDGLDKELSNAEIRGILGRPLALEELAKTLLDSALEHGGRDNVSVLLVEVWDADE